MNRTIAAFLVFFPAISFADEIEFNRDIRPILSHKCFFCHGPDEKQRQAELRLDVEKAAKESAIVPGRPQASELIARITSSDPETQMPPHDSGKSLTAKEIALLRQWVQEGAKYQGHWSFLTPVRPQPPAVKNADWPRNAIDRFVLSRLQAEGITPSPEADRASLIRRIALDLTGLPPSVEEVDRFVADRSPDALEKAVDRFLESDRYGEHMARIWLDAARYADTNGYQYDLEREQWVWRDWLIHAFNTNMPFDQFTIEQLAGDLLPGATDQQRLATAFHRNHPITIEGGIIDEEYRTEYVVDRVATTSTVWLGLTMTCARCHDHKYDPVSQKEFYRFFAFFNNVPERGMRGFDPKAKIESPLQKTMTARAEQLIAEAETRLDQLLDARRDELTKWTKKLAEETTAPWLVRVPDAYQSKGGATLTVQPDKSVLASGKNPASEVYELTLKVDRPVYAIRLEALKDKSFTGGGAGRAFNANFVLSEFQAATDSKQSPGEFSAVKIARAEADYEQKNYPISAAIDGRIDRGGWAVDGPTRREDCTAIFHLTAPITPDAVGTLRLQMHFAFGGNHQIGRFRVSLASQPVTKTPAAITAILAVSPDKRNADQQRRLRHYLADRFGDAELKQAARRVHRLHEQQASSSAVPATMIMAEMPAPRKTHVLLRGEYDKPREEVQAGTPAALPAMPDSLPQNRLGLAKWLTSKEHPLTARVTVNRLWRQLFGTGIVKTVEDFGSQGEWPSHPELLDWLAVDFVESGWDVKRLLKQMVLSATYRQTSFVSEQARAQDPENRLLARGPSSRLDAEVIRDSVLFVGGLLGERLGGPSVFPYQPAGLWREINNRPGYSRTYKQDSGAKLYRRSMYSFWKRTVPPPSMAAFDAPEREFCVVRRSKTNTPLQAFVLLHDPQFVEAARHLAQRVLTSPRKNDAERIHYAFQLCHARKPSDAETAVLAEVLESQRKRFLQSPEKAARLLNVGESKSSADVPPEELAAWTSLARTLMNLSEFVTKP